MNVEQAEDLAFVKMYALLVKAFFVVTGAVIISSAATFLAQHGCLNCTMVYWIPSTDILASWVYPVSVIIIGSFFILYGLKFGMRGVGLIVMVCGGFDVFAKFGQFYLSELINGTFTGAEGLNTFFWIQNALMFGGFILAGFPKLKADKYLAATVAILLLGELASYGNFFAYIQYGGFYTYQFYEVALFIWVYHSTTLRQFPRLAGLLK